MHKYHARRTVVYGVTFPSRAEAARWVQLQEALESGAIRDLERQVRYDLMGCGKYCADFRYLLKRGLGGYVLVVEDVKGVETAMFRLKRKLVKRLHKVTVTTVRMRSKDVDVLLAAAGGQSV